MSDATTNGTHTTRRELRPVTAGNPCPKCEGKKRCLVSADGTTVLCYRCSDGGQPTR